MIKYESLTSFHFNIIFLTLFTLLSVQTACAVTPHEVKDLKIKAMLAQNNLAIASRNGKNVSEVVPMMKRVKVLADKGKINEANILLDRILDKFQKMNQSVADESVMPKKLQVFINPRKVNIVGYTGSAMEPFITRDGEFIFYNSEGTRDTPKTNKDIYYAKRIDDTNFKFMGEIKGINSDKVDGVPTMDNDGNFYYISNIHYGKSNGFASVYSGKFKNGRVSNIKSHPELSLKIPRWLNMDIEISANGQTLYATQTYFDGGPAPKKSYFFVAHLKDDHFIIDKLSEKIFKHINTDDLEYAASISTNELEIYFTRLNSSNGHKFSTYRASRPNKNAPFSSPIRIASITGIAEAPAITSDGQLMYFHKKDGKYFSLYVLEKSIE